MMLKVGRHIRPRPQFKLIIGREEGENNFLSGYRKTFANLKTTSHAGPLVLLDGELTNEDIDLAARIVARYSQGREADKVALEYTSKEGVTKALEVVPMPPGEIPRAWYI
jgi:predicted ribosome quality control (RQC) complex YloA/Tae2 family protein